MNKNRFNLTFSDYIDDKQGRLIQFVQLTIFDRKTNKTIRLKLPSIYNNNPRLLALDLLSSKQSIRGFARYRNYPQSPELIAELLFLQKTHLFIKNNDINPTHLINDIFGDD